MAEAGGASPTSEEQVDLVKQKLFKAEESFNKQYKQKFGYNVTLKLGSLVNSLVTSGKVLIFKKGEEYRSPIAEIEIQVLESKDIKITGLDVAAEILYAEKKEINIEVDTTDLIISKYALALIDIGGGTLSSDNKTFTFLDGRKIDITGSNSAAKNITVKMMGVAGREKPTIIACTINKENQLKGYEIVLGDPTDFKEMTTEEVRKKCR